MARSRKRGDYSDLVGFYRFAAPHWKLILLAVLALLVSAAMNVNVLILVKPALNSLQQKEPGAVVPVAAEQEPTTPVREEPFHEWRDRARERVLNLPGLKQLISWLGSGDRLKKLAILMALGIAPLLFGSGFAYQYLHRKAVWRIMADLRMAVFEHLSGLSLGYFGRQRTGEVVSRLTNDIHSAQNALKLLFGKIVQQPLLLIGFFSVAVLASWELTLLVVACFPVIVLVQGRYGRRIRRHSQKNLERLADITDSITQMLQGIRVVKSFDREEEENEQFRSRTYQQLRRAFKLVRTRALADMLPEFLLVLLLAFVVVFAGRLVEQGKLTVAGMIQCVAALAATAGPVRRIVRAYNDLQESLAGVSRLFDLLGKKAEIEDRPDAIEIGGVRQGVAFENVWFAYDDEPVLRGIELFVPCGSMYAIVGETGAGKSTMLDLIPRFYDVEEGAVRIDGVDVRRIKRESLMRQIAIVGQHPFLFNRTIGENIRYGKPDATDEELVAAAEAANIHEFIQELPEAYETLAGERGGRFSGGQRQCITIARAILKDAPILILDEATSNLDAESEMLVRMALSNLMEGRTTFVIAHRLSTVRHADRIIVLKEGRIVEQGSHDELLELKGEYERLYRLQFFEDPADADRDTTLPGLARETHEDA
ncbi:MAG: ABC transporter ATP-binding protein [Candidatus Brocadiaceae bacterium]|jgi:subfamily B ATP-binding cassette protein MsbA